jgi:hypothetical protein
VVVLAVSVAVAVCWYRRRRRLDDSKYQSLTGSSDEVHKYVGSGLRWD